MLIELKVAETLLPDGHIWIGHFLVLPAKIQHHRSVRANVNEITPENPVKHWRKVNFGNQGFTGGGAFGIGTIRFGLHVALLKLGFHVLLVLLESHGGYRAIIQVSNLLINRVGFGQRINFHLGFYVIGIFEEKRRTGWWIGKPVAQSIANSKIRFYARFIRLGFGAVVIVQKSLRLRRKARKNQEQKPQSDSCNAFLKTDF